MIYIHTFFVVIFELAIILFNVREADLKGSNIAKFLAVIVCVMLCFQLIMTFSYALYHIGYIYLDWLKEVF